MSDLKDIILSLFGATGFGVIVVAVIYWIRFRKKDTATIEKTRAEAQEIRAKADVLITDGALRIVERLSQDLDEARDEIENLLKIVADLKSLHEKHKFEHMQETNGLNQKLREARDLIETKKRHCVDIKARIIQLRDLLQLKHDGLTPEQLKDFIGKLNAIAMFPD